jgi:sulfoxide reductase catalytic subunit YedY
VALVSDGDDPGRSTRDERREFAASGGKEGEMLIRASRVWEVKEGLSTPESIYRDRRSILKLMGFGVAAGLTGVGPSAGVAGQVEDSLYPAPRVDRYRSDRPMTKEILATRHNIFDEFSLEKDQVWQVAKGFRTSPWTIHIGGAIEKSIVVDLEDLVRRFGLEERLYRHRCVETWSMAVPWTGFPLKKLVDFAASLEQARFLRMVSFHRPEEAPGWYGSRRVFPYYEALSLAEATHDLAFLATGIYGKQLPPQNGAPLRLVIPWKYGYKSIKSIVAFQFTRERPGTFWNELAPHLYSHEANVDPTTVDPWPQAEETMLGEEEKRKTLPYNGYAREVAGLYA